MLPSQPTQSLCCCIGLFHSRGFTFVIAELHEASASPFFQLVEVSSNSSFALLCVNCYPHFMPWGTPVITSRSVDLKWFITAFETWRPIQLFTHLVAFPSSVHLLSLATRNFASFHIRKPGFKRKNGNCFLPPLMAPVPFCLYCRSLTVGECCSLPCLYKRWVATQIFAIIFEWKFYVVAVNPGRSKYAYCSKDICSLCYIWAGIEAFPRIERGFDAEAFSLSDNLCLCVDSYCA